jgi:hypothetical protein
MADSQAKRQGWDLGFMACSLQCGRLLRGMLREEVGLFVHVDAPPTLGPEEGASD